MVQKISEGISIEVKRKATTAEEKGKKRRRARGIK